MEQNTEKTIVHKGVEFTIRRGIKEVGVYCLKSATKYRPDPYYIISSDNWIPLHKSELHPSIKDDNLLEIGHNIFKAYTSGYRDGEVDKMRDIKRVLEIRR